MSSDFARVARAIRFLESSVDSQPSLAELGAQMGLSPFHTQRLFRRWAGITPKHFLQHLTLVRAKALLAAKLSVLETTQSVGLSSPGRLHDLFLTLEAMTPGEYKREGEGMTVGWDVQPTPLGEVLIATTPRGICAVSFIDGNQKEALLGLQQRWPLASLREDPATVGPIGKELGRRMRGLARRPLRLLLKGTAFQVQVWKAILEIPEGRVSSYLAVAGQLGSPRATRAVGAAVGQNPVAYLIPCHRVIRSTGAMGEYHWGTDRKAALLALESAR